MPEPAWLCSVAPGCWPVRAAPPRFRDAPARSERARGRSLRAATSQVRSRAAAPRKSSCSCTASPKLAWALHAARTRAHGAAATRTRPAVAASRPRSHAGRRAGELTDRRLRGSQRCLGVARGCSLSNFHAAAVPAFARRRPGRQTGRSCTAIVRLLRQSVRRSTRGLRSRGLPWHAGTCSRRKCWVCTHGLQRATALPARRCNSAFSRGAPAWHRLAYAAQARP